MDQVPIMERQKQKGCLRFEGFHRFHLLKHIIKYFKFETDCHENDKQWVYLFSKVLDDFFVFDPDRRNVITDTLMFSRNRSFVLPIGESLSSTHDVHEVYTVWKLLTPYEQDAFYDFVSSA